MGKKRGWRSGLYISENTSNMLQLIKNGKTGIVASSKYTLEKLNFIIDVDKNYLVHLFIDSEIDEMKDALRAVFFKRSLKETLNAIEEKTSSKTCKKFFDLKKSEMIFVINKVEKQIFEEEKNEKKSKEQSDSNF